MSQHEINEAFLLAASKADIDGLKDALNQGAELNAIVDDGNTCMHLLGYAANHLAFDCITYLLAEKNANIEMPNNYGATMLHIAARNNDHEKVRFLINKGADIHARDSDSWTPLHYAAWNDRLEACQCLIELGANALLETHDNKTSLTLACDPGSMFYSQELVDLLKCSMERQVLDSQIKSKKSISNITF